MVIVSEADMEAHLGRVDFKNPRIVLHTTSVPRHALLVNYEDSQLADLESFASYNYNFPGLPSVPIVYYRHGSGGRNNRSSCKATSPILPSQIVLASHGLRWHNYYNDHFEALRDVMREPSEMVVGRNSPPASIDDSNILWYDPASLLRLSVDVKDDGVADFVYNVSSGDGRMNIDYLFYWADFKGAAWVSDFVQFIKTDETGRYQPATIELLEARLEQARASAGKVPEHNFRDRFKDHSFYSLPYAHDLEVARNIAARLEPRGVVDPKEFEGIYNAAWDAMLLTELPKVLGSVIGNLSSIVGGARSRESSPIAGSHGQALEIILDRLGDGRLSIDDDSLRKQLGEAIVLHGRYLSSLADQDVRELGEERDDLVESIEEHRRMVHECAERLREIQSGEYERALESAEREKQGIDVGMRERLARVFGDDADVVEDLVENTEVVQPEESYEAYEVPF